LLLAAIVQASPAQGLSQASMPIGTGGALSYSIMAGWMEPHSRPLLTRFWKGGPGLAFNILFRGTPDLRVGVGIDACILWFKKSGFSNTYPSVEPLRRDLVWANFYLMSRYTFLRNAPVRPYADLELGASRLSGAEFKQVINGVRVTYYEIPGRTRLALTVAGGLDIPTSDELSIVLEAALRNVFNDDHIGAGWIYRGGVRVTL
jgi:hypothetical protein